MLISSMLIKKQTRVHARKGWIIRVCVLAKHDWMSEVLLSTAGCRTQVHVPQEGGLGCKEMETGEEVKCQRLVPLTLLQQLVIHETAPFPSLPNCVRGGGVNSLPVQADLPPSAGLCWSPLGLRDLWPHSDSPSLILGWGLKIWEQTV